MRVFNKIFIKKMIENSARIQFSEYTKPSLKNYKPPSKIFERNDSGFLLYIRHGQTHFNKYSHDFSEEEAKIKIEFLDCPLSDIGKNQSEYLSHQVNKYKIKYIFCSPLYRCLETCLLSLSSHPDKENLKVIVHPLVTETVHCIHDFSKRIYEKKEKFSRINTGLNFDWSLFDSLHENEVHAETYFIDFMDNLPEEENSYANELIKQIRDEQKYMDKRHEEVELHLLELSNFAAEKNQRPESLTNMFKRSVKFKEYIRSLEIPKEGEKILVYTHSCFVQISTSREAYKMEKIVEFPEDTYKPENCEVISMYV
jgi:bisphosphoglycerate-dependent phosphoglycerate mutase